MELRPAARKVVASDVLTYQYNSKYISFKYAYKI